MSLLAYPNVQMSREHIVCCLKWVYLHAYYNEQCLCIILCKYLHSPKVRVRNIQVRLLEVFLIFECFIRAISHLSTTSGTSYEHAGIATLTHKEQYFSRLQARCLLLFRWYQCLLPDLQGHITCSLLIKGWV